MDEFEDDMVDVICSDVDAYIYTLTRRKFALFYGDGDAQTVVQNEDMVDE